MRDQMLLVDSCEGFCELDLRESSADKDKGLMKFRGKFQEAEAVNKNKRSYPYTVLDENVKRLNEVVKNRGLIGELDHPTDSIIHFKDASHLITKLWWENSVLYGEGVVLSTPMGRVLRALMNDGVRVGVSSRGVGNGKVNEQGVLVIGSGYKLITFDCVADPSTFEAYQEKVLGTENYIPQKSTKNEGGSIHILKKEAVIAAFGGIIKSQTENVKNLIRK